MILALLLLACGEPVACEGVADLGNSPGGLEMTAAEHPGWGREQCLSCHPAATYHQQDCTSSVDVDLVALGALDAADPTACVSCHGGNGVPALEALAAAEDTGS